MQNQRQHLRKLPYLVFAMLLWVHTTAETHADFTLTISLSGPTQIAANQVAFNLDAIFTSTNALDYVNSFTVSLDSLNTSSELKLGVPSNYSRFTFDNLRSGWTGGVDLEFGTGGIAAVGEADFLRQANGSVVLSRILIDTTGLTSGPFQVSLFDPNISDASGFINGNQEASLIAGPPNGMINLNASSSFSIAAVPEPSSLLSIVCIGGIGMGVRRLRRRGAANNSASHRHEVGGDAGSDASDCIADQSVNHRHKVGGDGRPDSSDL